MNWKKHNVIDSYEMLAEVDQYLVAEDGTSNFEFIAFDTETNGLELYKTVVIGFSFATSRNEGFYLPLLVWVPDPNSAKERTKDKVKRTIFEDGHLQCFWTGEAYPEFVTPDQYKVPEFIIEILKRWFLKAKLIMHNAPFDINHVYINTGVDLTDALLVDTGLLVHIENENEPVGLKESTTRYREELHINPWVEANQEKMELKESIIVNGGGSGHVWRAAFDPQSKYACADAFRTFGVFEVSLERLQKEHGENYDKMLDWIFNQEVMPVCKEVVVNMKRRGVYTDVAHFQKLYDQNHIKMIELEDLFIQEITPFLDGFDKALSVDDTVSEGRFIRRLLQMENMNVPLVLDKKTGEEKESLAKNVVKKEYEKNPHWIFGYILGLDEIKYSVDEVAQIKQKLYEEIEERRYPFNINSNGHLGWLFFDKLKEEPRKFPETDGSTKENFKPSIEADAIKEHLLPKHEWINHLLKFKRLQKIQSTYVSPVLELNINGWLYMDMKQNGTTSGRFSCSGGYNLQTLPRVEDELELLDECDKCEKKAKDGFIEIEETIECMANRHCKNCGHVEYDIVRPSSIKKGFIAPPGYKIVNADYASLEPRCFAYMSGEDNIKQVYRDGLDLYSKVYIDIWDKEGKYSADPKASNFLKKANPKARKFVKPLVLGIPYGAGDAQVANMTGAMIRSKEPNKYGVYESRPNMEEGKRIRDAYLNAYPQLNYYMNDQEYKAITYGYVDTLFRRRRHFEVAKKSGEFFGKLFPGSEPHYVVQQFISCTKRKLTGTSIDTVSPQGMKFTMSNEQLKVLCELLDLHYTAVPEKGVKEGAAQKGGWAYIRSLIKADLNNAKNFPIQGIAGHIANIGMLDTNRHFRENGIDGWVALQVHDELMSYVRIDQAEQGKLLQQIGMEKNIYTLQIADEVVMIAEPTICDSLKESK